LKGLQKLEKMIEISQYLEAISEADFTERKLPPDHLSSLAARNFVEQALRPILLCLKNHHGNNNESFIARFRPFNHAKFAKVHCNGLAEGECGHLT